MQASPFPSQRALRARIRACYGRATPRQCKAGKRWYYQAHAFAAQLCEVHGLADIYQAAGLLAALSPGCPWEVNLRDAENVAVYGAAATVSTYGANRAKALAIRDGAAAQAVLGGPKVRAFWDAIARPDFCESVCIDRWVLRVVRWDGWLTLKRYRAIESAYQHVAQELGLQPHQLQAITWLVQRETQTTE